MLNVEHPSHKDVTRSWKLPGEDPNSEISAYFASVNFGKEYRFLDLATEEGHHSFLHMVADADIVLMNFKI